MLVTFTLNPAIDHTVRVDGALRIGGVYHSCAETWTPGGKGVNVAKMIAANGHAVRASGLLGRDAIDFYRGFLDPLGVETGFLELGAATRENTMLVGTDGRELKVNRPGFPDCRPDWPALLAHCDDVCNSGDVVVLSGSLPQRFAVDSYACLVRHLHARGCRVVLDTSGDALRDGVGAGPEAIKPNRTELESLAGQNLDNEEALVDAARACLADCSLVLVSDGARGAFFVAPQCILHAETPPVEVRDTTGAGDALLGQFCADYFASGREQLDETLVRRAVAAGSAAVELEGTPPVPITRVEELARAVRVRRVV